MHYNYCLNILNSFIGGVDMIDKLNKELIKGYTELPIANLDDLESIRKQTNSQQFKIPDNIKITNQYIPGPMYHPNLRVRVYQPKQFKPPLPAILYIHGGGFIFGTPEMQDQLCCLYVKEINCIVFSVDYRLAPEHPFPAAIEDCYSTLLWMSKNATKLGINPTKITLLGHSAGGGLATAVSLMARDRNGPSICFLMPLYPMLDDRNITLSSKQIKDNKVWNGDFNKKAWSMYLKGINKNAISYYAAPARADNYNGLPPTYTFIGDLDPFRDETINFVMHLSQSGVPTEFHLYPGCFHAFERIVPDAMISKQATNAYIEVLKKVLYDN